jgi:hypothetical protein
VLLPIVAEYAVTTPEDFGTDGLRTTADVRRADGKQLFPAFIYLKLLDKQICKRDLVYAARDGVLATI